MSNFVFRDIQYPDIQKSSNLPYQISRTDARFQLENIPIQDSTKPVVVTKILSAIQPNETVGLGDNPFVEVTGDITAENQFKVDYETGFVYFHESQKGKFVSVDYYYDNAYCIGYGQVWCPDNNGGITTLKKIIDESLASIEVLNELGGAGIMIKQLRADLENANTIYDIVAVANRLKNELNDIIIDINKAESQILNTKQECINKINETSSNAVDTVRNTRTEAINEINALKTEITTKKDNAISEIANATNSGISTINSNKTDAINQLNSAIDTANSILTSINEWTKINGNVIDKVNENTSKINSIKDIFINVKDFGAKGDGITDDTAAIQNAIDSIKDIGGTVFLPSGIYLISSTINFSGTNIEGVLQSGFGTTGTNPTTKTSVIKCTTNNFIALKQNSVKGADLTYSIKNIRIENADIGIQTSYTVNSCFENIFITNCRNGFEFGVYTILGGLFNTFVNIYIQDCEEYAFKLSGQGSPNNNVFTNCFFEGKKGSLIECNGGIGAVNNVFNSVEFRNDNGGRGVTVKRGVNTIFNHCYFESNASAVYLDENSDAVVNECIFALLVNNNSENDDSFITATNIANRILINGGYVYLSQTAEGTTMNNLRFINHIRGVNYIEMIKPPRASLTNITGWKLCANSDWNRTTRSSALLESEGVVDLVLKNTDETDGFQIRRNRGAGGTDYGVIFRFLNIIGFTLEKVGTAIKTVFKSNIEIEKELKIKNTGNLILQSPDGSYWIGTINNSGSLTWTKQ